MITLNTNRVVVSTGVYSSPGKQQISGKFFFLPEIVKQEDRKSPRSRLVWAKVNINDRQLEQTVIPIPNIPIGCMGIVVSNFHSEKF